MKRMGWWNLSLGLAGMVAFCTATLSELRAEDASDIPQIITTIGQNLSAMSDAIAELPRASSDAPVTRAVGYGYDLGKNVDRLRSVMAGNSDAERIVRDYPTYLEHFGRTAAALAKLKARDHSPQAAKMSCDGFQRDLQYQVQPFVDKNDPDGLVRIPEFVTTFTGKADAVGRAVESEKRDIDGYKSDAVYYSDSDGKWNDVHNSVVRSAKDLYTAWIVDFDAASKACAEVTVGMKSPFIDKAMSSLGISKSSRDQIIKDLDARLDAAASYLYGSEKDADDSRIASATTNIDAMSSLLSSLSYAKGADKQANHIVDEWPRNLIAFYAAAARLRNVKKRQFTLDSSTSKCAETDRQLQDFLAKQLDPTTIPAIEAEASL